MPKLTQANLDYHNASKQRSDDAPVKQTVERFHKENESYRKFLVTGHSAHQYDAQTKGDNKNKVHTGTSVIRWWINTRSLC